MRLTAIAGLPCGGQRPPEGLYELEDAGTLLLGPGGSAWLLGGAAGHFPSYVFGGSLDEDGTLHLHGSSEPAIVDWASPQPPHPFALQDLDPLSLAPGATPGTQIAQLPGGIEASLAPLRFGDRYVVYPRRLSLEDLAGRYSAMVGFLSAIHRELEVAADGSFSGRDFSVSGGVAPPDCRYQGQLALVPGTAEVTVAFTATGCGTRDGDYQGRGYVATVQDALGPGERLHFGGLSRDAGGQPRSAFQFSGVRRGGD